VLVFEAGFPMLDAKTPPRPEAGLIHAIIRQESNFSTTAVSSAGARGLMQLMPATAQQVAKKLGAKHSHEKLTADPAHNVRLGTTYLQELIDRFDGSYVLAIASYNAGSGRVATWLKEYGDPRSAAIDAIDWIELIPFQETRNYVQRVLENLHIYRARLAATPVSMSQDVKRGSGGPG
jgi:soluble lytic murein transglycosylase